MSKHRRQRTQRIPQDPDINRGDEHQARDGSNLRTMAEAEAEERIERRERLESPTLTEKPLDLPQARQPVDAEDGRTIPELIVSLATSPFRLVGALFKIQIARFAGAH